jgi:hypothetical protein
VSGFANDDLKTEPVSDRAGQLQHLRESDHGLGTRIPGAFWEWLMEYRSRLAKVLQDRTTNTGNS